MEANARFEATPAALPSILAWVEKQLEQVELPEQERRRAHLALEEAIVNVIEHASVNATPELTLHCRYEANRQVEFELSDQGVPFNPLLHPEPEPRGTTLDELEPGGLGISFMRKCMDALFYRYENGYNILTLVKNTAQEHE